MKYGLVPGLGPSTFILTVMMSTLTSPLYRSGGDLEVPSLSFPSFSLSRPQPPHIHGMDDLIQLILKALSENLAASREWGRKLWGGGEMLGKGDKLPSSYKMTKSW